MIHRFRGLLVLAVLAAALGCCQSAQAQGIGYGGYGGFFGFNAGAGPYNLYDNERVVPHFALYPPVYYSVPVPRTYGWSPFAYPPGVPTPDATPPAPSDVQNPHVPKKTSTAPTNRTAQAPLVIENPYFVSSPPASTPQVADAGN
jgi:hypothetical protein